MALKSNTMLWIALAVFEDIPFHLLNIFEIINSKERNYYLYVTYQIVGDRINRIRPKVKKSSIYLFLTIQSD